MEAFILGMFQRVRSGWSFCSSLLADLLDQTIVPDDESGALEGALINQIITAMEDDFRRGGF